MNVNVKKSSFSVDWKMALVAMFAIVIYFAMAIAPTEVSEIEVTFIPFLSSPHTYVCEKDVCGVILDATAPIPGLVFKGWRVESEKLPLEELSNVGKLKLTYNPYNGYGKFTAVYEMEGSSTIVTDEFRVVG